MRDHFPLPPLFVKEETTVFLAPNVFAKHFRILLIFWKYLGDRIIFPQRILEFGAQCFENTKFQMGSLVLSGFGEEVIYRAE